MEPSSGGEIPALLKAMSIRPNALRVASYMAVTSSALVTSAWMNRPSISSAAALPVSPSRSTTATLAPSAASRRALASPIPLPAPVTTATRSSRRCISASLLGCDEDVLGLGERGQGIQDQFPPQSRLLEAAERRPVADGGMGIDRQVAGLDRPRYPQCPAQVMRPDGAGQPVRGVIG